MKPGKILLAIGVGMTLTMALLFVLPGLAASVVPELVDGNPKCVDYNLVGYKPNETLTGTYTYNINGMGVLTMTIKNGPLVDWSSTFWIDKVIVKGGPNANVYSYSPASKGDTDLTTPTNPKNSTPYGLSHVEFCYSDQQAVQADFGDLPTAYGLTQLGENGARHIPVNNDVILGSLRDLELNGSPDDSALGDDNDDSSNDEDGVIRGPSWGGGQGVISVSVSGPSCLMGWVDWAKVDESNTFVDVGHDFKFSENFSIGSIVYTEKVIDNLYLPGAGIYQFTFPLPSDFKNAIVYARFRLSPATFSIPAGTLASEDEYVQCDQTAAGLSGLVMGGEVEDYYWRFGPTAVNLKRISAVPQQSAAGFGLLVVGLVASLTAVWFGRRRQ
ncbi:MAG: hypothetical protein DDG59_05865 [Anaerolineae bacterium]|jgi:hypothetical protein|nr:MAG: hypothetical protein DDG59_05865 [Anaerolineae bacterium]